VPDHTIALALLAEFKKLGGKGIAAPSANRFGHVSPTTAQAVHEELADFISDGDLVLDGGPSFVGVESTIIDCTRSAPRILRPGAISVEEIERVTGVKVTSSGDAIRVSGALEQHYAPAATVLLDVTPQAGDGLIALSDFQTPPGVIRLAAPITNEDFARELYGALRDADNQKLVKVVVIQPNGSDIAIAIRDRLQRASAGR
jgi:L-threonylcarbamoyladenylate synthase